MRLINSLYAGSKNIETKVRGLEFCDGTSVLNQARAAGEMDVTAYHIFWAMLCMSGLVSMTYWAMFSPQSDCTVTRWLVAIILSLVISVRGMRRNSLDFSGGMSSMVIGLLLTITNAAFFSSMIAFYLSSSALTKWKSAEKKKVEADFKEGKIALNLVC